MKIKDTFVMRQIRDEQILIPVGKAVTKYNGVFTLTPVAACIVSELENETDKEKIIKAVTDTFEVEREQAEKDVEEFINILKKAEIIDI